MDGKSVLDDIKNVNNMGLECGLIFVCSSKFIPLKVSFNKRNYKSRFWLLL